MKKIIVVLITGILFLTGCEEKKKLEADYSKYSFTDVSWTRDGENDIETIRFNSDGSFSYYCSCGNSVNDSDMCESYTYNDETKEIEFNCFETTEDMITTIKVINYTDTTLELDFDGEVRTFKKSK